MLKKIKDILFGELRYSDQFVRLVVVQSNKGPLHLYLKQPVTSRKRFSKKRKNGNCFWELQNTIANPFFGRSQQETPASALNEILKEIGLPFLVNWHRNEGTFSITFTD